MPADTMATSDPRPAADRPAGELPESLPRFMRQRLSAEPRLAAFLEAVAAAADSADEQTFVACLPAFRAILDVQLIRRVLNDELASLCADPAHNCGRSTEDYFNIFQYRKLSLSLRILQPAAA